MKVSRFLAYCKEFLSGMERCRRAEFVRVTNSRWIVHSKSLSRGQRVKRRWRQLLAYHPSLLFLDGRSAILTFWCADQLI